MWGWCVKKCKRSIKAEDYKKLSGYQKWEKKPQKGLWR